MPNLKITSAQDKDIIFTWRRNTRFIHKNRYKSSTMATPSQANKIIKKKRPNHGKTSKAWEEPDRIFNAITDPIIVFDEDFNVIKINTEAKHFFTGHPVGKKCFFIKHKFAMACKNCPTWQTLKTGKATTSEILSPQTGDLLLLKTYPIYNRLKKVKGVILIGRESTDVPVKWKK